MRRVPEKDRGFTLLEVLIAVLILGIIATAALPMLSSYTEKAREAREEANMVVKVQAIDRYNMDHQASLGTVYDPSDGSLVTYGLATMQGATAQLLLPTDVNGNVMDDPMTPNLNLPSMSAVASPDFSELASSRSLRTGDDA